MNNKTTSYKKLGSKYLKLKYKYDSLLNFRLSKDNAEYSFLPTYIK